MTVDVRPFDDLGRFQIDWLDAKHHFSFGHYMDPARMGVGPLRVWNDDTIQPKTGFDPHPHRDMEIITYVRQGAITHRDNLGNEGRTEAGDIQIMSAGTGIVHAEYNLEDTETRLFQIWIMPRTRGLTPRWETRAFPQADKQGRLVPMASGDPAHPDAAPIDQDATLYAGNLLAGDRLTHRLAPERSAYLVPARGRLRVDGVAVDTRDGAVISGTDTVAIEVEEDAEVILVDVAA